MVGGADEARPHARVGLPSESRQCQVVASYPRLVFLPQAQPSPTLRIRSLTIWCAPPSLTTT